MRKEKQKLIYGELQNYQSPTGDRPPIINRTMIVNLINPLTSKHQHTNVLLQTTNPPTNDNQPLMVFLYKLVFVRFLHYL